MGVINTAEDLCSAAGVVGSEVPLVGRVDSSVLGITSIGSRKRTVKGILMRCANVGSLLGKLNGNTIFIADLATMNVMLQPLPVNVEVPVGATFALTQKSTSGTGAAGATVQTEDTVS